MAEDGEVTRPVVLAIAGLVLFHHHNEHPVQAVLDAAGRTFIECGIEIGGRSSERGWARGMARKTTHQNRYYILSTPLAAPHFNRVVCAHWDGGPL